MAPDAKAPATSLQPIFRAYSSQTLIVVEALVSNGGPLVTSARRADRTAAAWRPHLTRPIACAASVHILDYAHRQIHAKDAGGAAGGARPRFATERFRNHER